MTGPLRQTARGLLLDVKATPKAARDQVAGLSTSADGSMALAIKVTAPPDKGKANAAIVALIAKSAHIPKSALALVAGETDRNKVFAVLSHAVEIRAWLDRTLMDLAGEKA